MPALSSQFNLPEIGAAEVPEGHERFYHQTDAANLPSIREHGLQASRSATREGQSGVHLSREPWSSPTEHEHIATIEVAVPEHEGGPDTRLEGEDIDPSRFLAVHEPWHHKARQIMGNPRHLERALSGGLDRYADHPAWGPAIAHVKQIHGL